MLLQAANLLANRAQTAWQELKVQKCAVLARAQGANVSAVLVRWSAVNRLCSFASSLGSRRLASHKLS